MPKETWWNLPDAKRDRIVHAAMVEFGAKGFSAGSLNVVAREAHIAKGSLFQYFTDKLDLFATVCEVGSDRIEREVLGSTTIDGLPYFEMLRTVLPRWVRYFRSHPIEQSMSYAAANEIDADARAAVRGVANAHYVSVLRPLVAAAAARGEFRPGVEQDHVISMTVLLLRHLDSAPFDPDVDPVLGLVDRDPADVDRVVLELVGVLERGFSS